MRWASSDLAQSLNVFVFLALFNFFLSADLNLDSSLFHRKTRIGAILSLTGQVNS